MKEKVDALVEHLNDLEPAVRLDAIRELATCDPEHAVAALHWAMVNDLDEQVRAAAKTAYETLRKAQEDKSKAAEEEARKTAEEHAPRPTTAAARTQGPRTAAATAASTAGAREAATPSAAARPRAPIRRVPTTGGLDTYVAKDELIPNPLGDLSFYFGLTALGLLVLSTLLKMPHYGFAIPLFLRILTWTAVAITLPGTVLGIVAVTRGGAHLARGVVGLILNGLQFALAAVIAVVGGTL